VRSLKNETFIEAAIALGIPTWRSSVACAAERRLADHRAGRRSAWVSPSSPPSSLGFLGLGAPPPDPEMGADDADSP